MPMDLFLDRIHRADALERFCAAQGFVGELNIVKLPAHMRPTRGFLNASAFVDLLEPRVCIGLQRPAELLQMRSGMFALAVRRVGEPHRSWRRISSGPIVSYVRPQSSGFCLSQTRRQHRNRR